MAKRKKENDFDILRRRISEYVDAAIADSWKGGGDPADRDAIELFRAYSLAALNAHIMKMERERE